MLSYPPYEKREDVKMKNKLAKIMTVLTVVGLMAAGPVAYAESEGNNPENGKGDQRGGVPGFLEELNLTPEQREKFMAQQDPAKMESNKARMEQLNTKMDALNAAVAKPGTTQKDVSKLIAEVGALQAQMLSQRMERLFAMKEILTPEQFAKMQEMEKQRMKKGPGDLGEKNQRPNQN